MTNKYPRRVKLTPKHCRFKACIIPEEDKPLKWLDCRFCQHLRVYWRGA